MKSLKHLKVKNDSNNKLTLMEMCFGGKFSHIALYSKVKKTLAPMHLILNIAFFRVDLTTRMAVVQG